MFWRGPLLFCSPPTWAAGQGGPCGWRQGPVPPDTTDSFTWEGYTSRPIYLPVAIFGEIYWYCSGKEGLAVLGEKSENMGLLSQTLTAEPGVGYLGGGREEGERKSCCGCYQQNCTGGMKLRLVSTTWQVHQKPTRLSLHGREAGAPLPHGWCPARLHRPCTIERQERLSLHGWCPGGYQGRPRTLMLHPRRTCPSAVISRYRGQDVSTEGQGYSTFSVNPTP